MKKPVYISIVYLTLISCSNNTTKELDAWLGDYLYTEQFIVSFNGQTEPIEWQLSVNRINEMHKAILNVHSTQSGFSLYCDLSGNNDRLYIKYAEALSGKFNNLEVGDTLFILSRLNNAIRTNWKVAYSLLHTKTPIECNCFSYSGINENNNTIIIHQQ